MPRRAPKPHPTLGKSVMMTDDRDDELISRDDAYAARRRREGRTPHGIRRRNQNHTSGTLAFYVNDEGTELTIVTRSKPRPVDKFIMALMKQAVASMWVRKSGADLAVFTARKGANWMQVLGMKPVPEPCARCEGRGLVRRDEASNIDDPIPCPACHGTGRALADPAADEGA